MPVADRGCNALVAEIDYVARLAHVTKRDRVDYPALAREIGLSHEGLTAIVKQGAAPRLDTLQRLAHFARQHDPSYSIIRLFIAAGWLTAQDIERAGYRRDASEDTLMEEGATALINRARDAAGLSEEDVERVYHFLRAVTTTLERAQDRRESEPSEPLRLPQQTGELNGR